MKLFIAIIAVSAAFVSVQAQGLFSNAPVTLESSSKKVVGKDNIIAVVEDRVITREEIMKEVERFIPQLKSGARSEFEFNQRVNAYMNEIVQNMVDRELIVKEFKDKGMTIPQSYLDTNFDDYLKREFNGERAEFLKFIQGQGKTIKQFRDDQEKDIIVGYMQNQKRQTASQISPKRIIDYYHAHKDKWFSPASARISMITLKPNMSATVESNKKLAEEIMQKLKAGESFADLARRYSKDDSSAKGGEWGWYKKGELSPQLDSKTFALEVGKTTEPVLLGDTIFILKVEEKKPEGIQTLDDVREQIEWIIIDENSKQTHQKWLEGLRKKAFVKYFQ